MRPIDLTGKRFGMLTVLTRADNTPGGKTRWDCVCDCGDYATVRGEDIRSGKIKSCGCLRKKTAAAQGKTNTSHGGTGTRLYAEWNGMRGRCENSNGLPYSNYGGRGIVVCDEWRDSFEAFREWALANGYRDDLTLDRKDTNGPYSPDNCRWATMKEQQNNRRNNRLITHDGKTQTIAQWADQTGIAAATISWRLQAGWPASDLFIPARLNNARIRKERNKNA